MNSPAVRKAFDEVFEELKAMPTDEFRKLLDSHMPSEDRLIHLPAGELDIYSMEFLRQT